MAATVTDLISSTITTLEAATHYYNIVKDDKGLREAFHEAGRGLLLVEQALREARPDPARVAQSAMNLLRECDTKAELSKSIFEAVAKAPETSRFERYKEAVRQEGKGRTVEVLMMGMMNDVCALAENDGIKTAMKDQVKGLREAIEKLSKMEPSVPKEGPGDTYINWGGDMMNAPGGRATKNDFNGANISGPMSF